jgi:4-hydroxy-tetrahydrodipicolinate synthase
MMAIEYGWTGVFPATLCPFQLDETIDEQGLFEYIADLASVRGVNGVTCNGHTGEIMSLRATERERVTRIVAKAVRSGAGQQIGGRLGDLDGDGQGNGHGVAGHANGDSSTVKVISGVSAEGSLEAIDHAAAAKDAGADAILLMPPHHWLRFGRTPQTAVGFFEDVAEAGIPIIVHQYPAWTKAGYSLQEMLEIVKIPQVVSIKMGTRDMARWRNDYEVLKSAAPRVSIITCHDEFLLPTLLDGCDGALVGFAGFVPELIVELVHRALAGDLAGARAVQRKVEPLSRIVYGLGEPSSDAHQRMKCARWLMGRFPSPKMRRPLRDLDARAVSKIRTALAAAGYGTIASEPSAALV